MSRSPRLTLIIALSAGLLAACVSVLPEAGPAPALYRLAADNLIGPEKTDNIVVEIALPSAPRVLSGNRIAAVEAGGEIVYIAGARWAAPAPNLLQSLATAHLSTSPVIRAALRPEDGALADIQLRLDIKAFEYVRARQEGETILVATLINARDRSVIGSARFARTANATGDSEREAVAAINQAAQDVMRDVQRWSTGRLSAHESDVPA